jgi:hypothetical protein
MRPRQCNPFASLTPGDICRSSGNHDVSEQNAVKMLVFWASADNHPPPGARSGGAAFRWCPAECILSGHLNSRRRAVRIRGNSSPAHVVTFRVSSQNLEFCTGPDLLPAVAYHMSVVWADPLVQMT